MKEELIDKSWSDPESEIVKHILKVQEQFCVSERCVMNKITINSVLWYSVLTNNQVRIVSSTKSQYVDYNRERRKDGGFYAVILGLPFITFHITDDVDMGADGVLKKRIEDDTAIFGTDQLEEAWPIKVVF